MRTGALRRVLPAAALLLCACAMTPPRAPLSAAPVELVATPFFPQEIHQCGPAALATVLAGDDASVTPETLTGEVYVPGREGSFQVELVASMRRHGRVPVSVKPNLAGLVEALDAGKPVLVLQNLGLGFWPQWHYAVVVGYDPSTDAFILRSGTTQRLTTDAHSFERTWRLAKYWGIVAARPGDPPAFTTAAAWVSSVAPFESLKQPSLAEEAYRAAGARWPGAALPMQALANVRYAAGDLPGAENALRIALGRSPDAATRNNLANVLLERGCSSAARRELEAIGEVPPEIAGAVEETREAVDSASADSSACGP